MVDVYRETHQSLDSTLENLLSRDRLLRFFVDYTSNVQK